MKRIAAALAILILAGASLSAAEAKKKVKIELDPIKTAPREMDAGGMALGLFLGQPTGLSFRLGLSAEQSLEAKAAWDFVGSKDGAAQFAFQANWLLELPGTLVIEDVDIPPYIGAGVALGVGNEVSLGLRVPFGLVYRFEKAPLELGLEVGVGMSLVPATKFAIDGGLALRYRLK